MIDRPIIDNKKIAEIKIIDIRLGLKPIFKTLQAIQEIGIILEVDEIMKSHKMIFKMNTRIVK
jgi:hypothetical protein